MTTPPFKVQGINHVGLAPKDPEKAKWFFEKLLGLENLGEELVAPQKVNTVMLTSSVIDQKNSASGSSRLEILESTDPEGPIGKFITKKGSGIHHLALTVDNVSAAISHLLKEGVKMVDESPREGAHSTKIAFVHPASAGGLLIELVQEA